MTCQGKARAFPRRLVGFLEQADGSVRCVFIPRVPCLPVYSRKQGSYLGIFFSKAARGTVSLWRFVRGSARANALLPVTASCLPDSDAADAGCAAGEMSGRRASCGGLSSPYTTFYKEMQEGLGAE